MKNPLTHAYRVIQANLRERKKAKERSPKWAGVRDRYLKKHPVCEACGAKSKLQVHHRQPFHLFPELELEGTNLVTLCMTIRECHLEIGHGTFWKLFNARLEEHLQRLRLNPKDRQQVEKEARSSALAVK
jgi:5-methylcytosine-specific restriction endonuclease McrA